jgi:hypothetical protein
MPTSIYRDEDSAQRDPCSRVTCPQEGEVERPDVQLQWLPGHIQPVGEKARPSRVSQWGHNHVLDI